MNNKEYYIENLKYTNFLNNQKKEDFNKYADHINKLLFENGKFLDIGCGTGIALSLIDNKKNIGVDVSKTSIDSCLKKGLDCQLYDGNKLPFLNNTFNVVGSFNVLEHVDDPINILNEQVRVLKSGGYLIIACPNFLSVSNNYHWHTAGLIQKAENLMNFISKILFRSVNFQKMKTIHREDFHPDDDACNITNPIDIMKWANKNNLTIKYWSGQSVYKNSLIINVLDKTFLKIFFGACFFVYKK